MTVTTFCINMQRISSSWCHINNIWLFPTLGAETGRFWKRTETIPWLLISCFVTSPRWWNREIRVCVSWDKFSTTRVKYYYNTNHRQDIARAIVDLDPYVVTGSQCAKCSYSVLAYFQPHIHSMENKLRITGPSITVMSNERDGFQITGHSI